MNTGVSVTGVLNSQQPHILAQRHEPVPTRLQRGDQFRHRGRRRRQLMKCQNVRVHALLLAPLNLRQD